jgi:ubiquinone biosynthesis protein
MFKLLELQRSFAILARILQILRVLVRYYLWQSIGSTILGRLFLSKTRHKRLKYRTNPERIRLILEDLGPTFIKFGQILADRPDIMPEVYRAELKKLQSHAKPLSDELAHRLIEQELHGPIEDHFEYISAKHIASASIGQVYRGKLKTGEEVIIKVQRPNILDKIKLDLVLMDILVNRMIQQYPVLNQLNLLQVVDEFGKTIQEELNYLNEAANTQRFADMFRGQQHIHVPQVYMKYTTRYLLVMEFVEGVPPDNIEDIKAYGLDLEVVARNGATLILDMIFRHGFFHADPHSGNIFLLKGNRICFIDFGMVGVLKPKEISFLSNFILGFAQFNETQMTDALIILCDKKYFPSRKELEFEVSQLLKKYSYQPIDQIDVAQVIQECIQIVVRYNLSIPGSLFLLLKSLATIQKFAFDIYPDLPFNDILVPYAKELLMKKYSIRNFATSLYETLSDWTNLFREFPSEINEILYKVKEGKITHEISIRQQDQIDRSLNRLVNRIGIAMLIGFVLTGSAIISVWGENRVIGEQIFGVTIAIAAIAALRLFFFKNR